MRDADEKNWFFVERMLNKVGWLGFDEVGKEANEAIFLVLVHQCLYERIKWLTALKKSVSLGKSELKHLLQLEQRINLDLQREFINKNRFHKNTKIKVFSVTEEFSQSSLSKIKDEYKIDVVKFSLFVNDIEKILNYPEDFYLFSGLIQEKIEDLFVLVKDSVPNNKAVDVKQYLEILIRSSTDASIEYTKPLIENSQENLILSFSDFLLENKKLTIKFDKKYLVPLATKIIKLLFDEDDKLSKDKVSDVIFARKDSINQDFLKSMLDSIENVKDNPFQFFYMFGLTKQYTLQNLGSLGEQTAKIIRLVCLEIQSKAQHYNIKLFVDADELIN